ncbi:MAG: porin [Alphaproteobacteria bacterium]
MKKLLCSAAVCGLALAATPAQAEDGLTLDVGGYFKGYGFYTNLDDETAADGAGENRDIDIIRNTEVHFSGETTLDNGLTVGMHIESGADNEDGFAVNETYAYFSGGWGRVNFGSEDGAAYLLQVEAPSADDNLDGIRQFVNPINYAAIGDLAGAATGLTALNIDGSGSTGGLDYDQDVTGISDKLTYLSPIMNGFQAGLSYTPDVADGSNENAGNLDDVDDALGSAWEAGVRYEGQFNNIGIIAGAGYTHVDLEEQVGAQAGGDSFSDDREVWNAGLDLDIGPFGVGAAYMNDNFGDDPLSATTEQEEEETWVVGVDYTTGPFKLGASYLNQEGSANIAGATGEEGVEVDRYTGGVVYTYGPGMTFRGSISHAEFENVAGIAGGSTDADATSVVIGTQINF